MEEMGITTFWKDKKVLITGHTGFKGSWLVLMLQSLGAKVIGYALPPATQPNLFTVANVDTDIQNIYGNVCDLAPLQKVIKENQPEIIFHLAAQAIVRKSYTDPINTYQTNVMGTLNLLEASRASVKSFICVTSDKCYAQSNNSLTENDRLGGYDPYSSSKACVELLVDSYRQSYDMQCIATVRAGNVIGGGDWAQDRLIPDIVRARWDNAELQIRYPNAVRPWQHVFEPLLGYILLAQKLYQEPNTYAEAWNFGIEDEECTVRDILQHFSIPFVVRSSELYESQCLKLNANKAKKILNWKNQWRIQDSLDATLRWYEAYYASSDMRAFSLGQIDEYLRLH